MPFDFFYHAAVCYRIDSMKTIVVTSKKPILTAERGRLPAGIPITVSDLLAQMLIERGEAVLKETKDAIDRPTKAAGEVQLSSALPVAPALPSTTASESEPGETPKRRGRPRKNVA